ncbi:MAG: DUF4097 family beta strand repeat protein [Saprospiraceae bacterium]|nr:DUF4097 family beta strand repeat protein [Saprospiraceae bacterium]
MKNLILYICLLGFIQMQAQESYTIDGASGELYIHEINKVTLVGSNESKLTVEVDGKLYETPEKSKGLKLINPAGYSDNTGIGLHVSKDGNSYSFRRISNKKGNRYIFHVPKGYHVHYESSSYNAGTLHINDVEAELDVSANYNRVELSGVTGPMAIHSVYGGIEAKFSSVSQEGPISLYSVYSDVDVSVPANTKANFNLKVSYGDVFSDIDLSYPQSEDGFKHLNAKKFTGLMNGGGVDFTLKSGYNNVYLRKQ